MQSVLRNRAFPIAIACCSILTLITAVVDAAGLSEQEQKLIYSRAYDAKFFEVELPEGTAMTVQNRAYTSPTWYTPYPQLE